MSVKTCAEEQETVPGLFSIKMENVSLRKISTNSFPMIKQLERYQDQKTVEVRYNMISYRF